MVWLKCNHKDCSRKWDYKGKKKIYTTCPDCQRKIKIKENRIKKTKD